MCGAMTSDDALADLGLTAAEREVLRGAIGAKDDGAFAERIARLRNHATTEYVEWLIGRKRFTSMSELDTDRILHLFLDVREQVPTVETLVSEIGLSAGRATSLLSRLRYGEARQLRKLAIKQAFTELEQQLAMVEENASRKTVWVPVEIFDIVFEAAGAIMQAPEEHGRKRKWEQAEMPTGNRSRFVSTVTASTKMWSHVIGLLKSES
jgi:hypothetical protein